eukprot:gene19743-25675_t
MNVGVEASYFFIKEDEDNDILNKDLQNRPLSDGTKPRDIKTSPPLYEVDFVGNGSYQVTQLNLLKKRNIELIKDTAAKLSARGIIHRPFEQFNKEVRNASAVIQTALQNEILTSVKTSSKKGHKAARRPAYLFNSYFQRALGYERLNQLEDALNDYNVCLEIDNKHAPAYFNRAGILHAQGKLDEAIDDLSKAIFHDPSNPTYRSNRSLLYREKGIYLEAIDEIMIARAIKSEPHIASELKAGRDVHIDSDTLKSTKIEADPIVTALTGPKYQRTFKNIIPVVDFLSNLKFFSKFHNDRDFLKRIAIKLELEIYNKEDVIFHEGHVGHHFYMILDGEVSIVKTKVYKKSKLIENITLVKLFRGQTFGETALDGNGLRTAGAVATQQTYLLVLHERDYHAGKSVDALKIWETYLDVTKHTVMKWDDENRHRLPKARDDGSIFVSLGSYRDPFCTMTMKSLYSMAEHPGKIFVGLFQQNCFEKKCRTGVLQGGKVEDAGPDADCYKEFCSSNEGKVSNACVNNQVRLFNVNESESLGPYMARYLG